MRKILLTLLVITNFNSPKIFASTTSTTGEGGSQQESLSLPCAKALQNGGKDLPSQSSFTTSQDKAQSSSL